ncbi:MAG: helix-turn-helix domain-containing protein [Ruminococcus callidus]
MLSGPYLSKSTASPITYLNCRRIEEANICGQYRYSLAQISELMGLSSPSYFSQCFRKAEGLTPNEYRRQVRQGQRPAPAKRHER